MGRSAVAVVVSAAFVAALLLSPFTHLHLGGAAHDHAAQAGHGSPGLVHTHLAEHHHDHHGAAGTGERWVSDHATHIVPLATMLSEPGKTVVAFVMLEAAHVPPAPRSATARSVLTLPHAHGPPDGFPVIGRAPPV